MRTTGVGSPRSISPIHLFHRYLNEKEKKSKGTNKTVDLCPTVIQLIFKRVHERSSNV